MRCSSCGADDRCEGSGQLPRRLYERNRAECPACRTSCALNRHGRIWPHKVPLDRRADCARHSPVVLPPPPPPPDENPGLRSTGWFQRIAYPAFRRLFLRSLAERPPWRRTTKRRAR